MSGGIFLIRNGELVEMHEEIYPSEDVLQRLLAQYPNLLAGDQVDSLRPRRWLLISREVGVPSEEGGSDRWSVDHLFLDQDAVPTIVEVKRSSDTRIRREVVGQMLDYAANSVVYWPVETIRARFETNHGDPDKVLADFLEAINADVEEFWQKVKTNLQAGKVRLVFVADEVPVELRRVVEFLNQQMDPVEVLAVEVKQYVGEDLRTLVPRVIGQTLPHPSPHGPWDKESFFQELQVQAPEAVESAHAIFDWATKNTSRIEWGKGKQYGTFYPVVTHKGTEHKPIQVWTGDYLYILLGDMSNEPPFNNESKCLELLRQLNQIDGVSIPVSTTERYPTIALTTLSRGGSLKQFCGILDWVVEEINAT
jgi:hypothetical protein